METLRVGFAGYGVVGKLRRKYVDEHSSFTTVAVSDRNLKGHGFLEQSVKSFPD